MTSLFSKARVLVLGNLHTLLDAAIDLNSIAAVKQHIRDLESARDGISSQAAVSKGRVNSITADIKNLEKEIAEAQDNIDLLLGDDDPDNDANAVTIQMMADGLTTRVEALQSELATATETASKMDEALQKIRQKHAEMVSQVKTLEQMDASAKASEQAASAIEAAGKISNFDSSASIDNIQQRVRDRKATADAKLEQAFGGIDSTTDDSVALAKAKQAIAARKAALGKSAAA